MSPGVVTSVRDPLVAADPNQPVGAVVELRLAELALPIPVTVLDVADQLRLCLARVVLQDLVLLCPRCNHTNS